MPVVPLDPWFDQLYHQVIPGDEAVGAGRRGSRVRGNAPFAVRAAVADGCSGVDGCARVNGCSGVDDRAIAG